MVTTMAPLALLALAGATAASPLAVAPAPPPPATSCGQWQKGISLNGHDIGFRITNTAGACCDACHSTVGASKCTGWTWNLAGHRCYFKNKLTGQSNASAISVSQRLLACPLVFSLPALLSIP